MPFRAEFELNSKDCRLLWTKSISGFQSISDSFKIVIYQGNDSGYDNNGRKSYSEVQFVTMNKTKTTILDISFKECFFQKFKIDGEISNVSNNYNNNVSNNQLRHNYANCYTMIVNSKDMNVLFKDCGEDAISWKIFMVVSDDVTHMVYSNKLFVEFITKSKMKKKYSIRYRPGMNTFDSKIHCIYLRTLENQKLKDEREEAGENIEGGDCDFDMFDDDDDDERIHRVAMESIILHRFIQTFPISIEDFMIEVDPILAKIIFKGFNRSQITTKNVDFTRRPITLSITMSLDQTVYNNIKKVETKDINNNLSKDIRKLDYEKYNVSTRLKDLKTFIQIISSNLAMFNEEEISTNNGYKYINEAEVKQFNEEENVCDIMYSKPGYPIIFERRYFLNGIHEMKECSSVTLTEISDGQSNKIFEDSNINYNTEVNVNEKLGNLTVSQNTVKNRANRTRIRTVSPNLDSINRGNNIEINDNPTNIEEPLFLSENYEGNNDEIYNDYKETTSKNFENIFWENSKYHQTRVIDKNVKKVKETITIIDGKEGKENDNEVENEGSQVDYLGPTQTAQVKGIFD